MRESDFKAVKAAFAQVWPWEYGASAKINSKDPRSKKHREAFDRLIAAVWPAATDQKFYAVHGFPRRGKFHRERLRISLG
jgi:hypothetical protein